MSMKSKGLMYAMMAMAMEGNMGMTGRREFRELTESEKQELKIIAENKRIEKLKEKGVKEFTYHSEEHGTNVLFARNQKNADRKAKNNGYL